MDRHWGLLHLFFAFRFAGGLAPERDGRMARTVSDGPQRALLLGNAAASLLALALLALLVFRWRS